MLIGFAWPRIAEALRILETQSRGEDRLPGLMTDYEAPHASEKVVRLIVSYAHHVRRTVWGPQQRLWYARRPRPGDARR